MHATTPVTPLTPAELTALYGPRYASLDAQLRKMRVRRWS